MQDVSRAAQHSQEKCVFLFQNLTIINEIYRVFYLELRPTGANFLTARRRKECLQPHCLSTSMARGIQVSIAKPLAP